MSQPDPRIRSRVVAPRFGGRLASDFAICYRGMAQATVCADVTRLELGCSDQGAIIAARHLTYGCPPAIAAAEWLCQRLEGETLAVARNLSVADVTAGLGLVGVQEHAAQTVIAALASALPPSI